MTNINPDLVSIALDKCGTAAFEKYAQTALGQILGPKFKPLGGHKDGGADGFVDTDVLEFEGKPTKFFQASKELNVESKVRKTVARLREVGRDVKTLYYASSQPVPNIDKLQYDLGEELDIALDIYDSKYFEQHANQTLDLQVAFEKLLRPSLTFLEELTPSFPAKSPISNAQAVCAFLGQELERRIGTVRTLEGICDALIVWALEGTDPDKKIVLSISQIRAKIEGVVPSSKQFIRGHLETRLKALSVKKAGARTVQHHTKLGGYCLPFETRQAIQQTTIEDEKLKLDVTASFIDRIATAKTAEVSDASLEHIPNLLHATLEAVFEKQGYDASRHFLELDSNAIDSNTIIDIARDCLKQTPIHKKQYDSVLDLLKKVFREVFYASRPVERSYCSRLARTYIMLFTIRNTPEIIEHFNTMTKNFVLCVGSDLLVRALSEYYVRDEDQMTCNALKIIHKAGSKLILTEPTLAELHSHIHAADREFQSTYADIDPLVDVALASQCEKILIRAYYYAKLDPSKNKRPGGWTQFLGNFLTYDKMKGPTSPASMKSLRDTLINRFDLEYLPQEEMIKLVSEKDLQLLADKIIEFRKHKRSHEEIRAKNDALHILYVRGKRKTEGGSTGNPFGYRSWWLTQEVVSGAAAGVVFPSLSAERYIMYPEFLINYIAFNPTTADVRASLKDIFPSLHGVRLGNRLDSKTYDKVIEHIRVAQSVDPARAAAMASEASDALMTHRAREFVIKYNS